MVTASLWTEGRENFNYPNYAKKTHDAGNLIIFYFKTLGLIFYKPTSKGLREKREAATWHLRHHLGQLLEGTGKPGKIKG